MVNPYDGDGNSFCIFFKNTSDFEPDLAFYKFILLTIF